jgi:hypothetical protein
MKSVLFLICLFATGTWAGAVFEEPGPVRWPYVPAKDCLELGFHGAWYPSPCPSPPPKDAEAIAARTRAIVAAFEREEGAKAAAFYKEHIVPRLEEHLAALSRMLAAGALEPILANTLLVDWPANGTKTMRREVCARLKEQGFECIEGTNRALDLFIVWF